MDNVTMIFDQWYFWPSAITTNGGGEWMWTRVHVRDGQVVLRYAL
jgi:hypothetical protein